MLGVKVGLSEGRQRQGMEKGQVKVEEGSGANRFPKSKAVFDSRWRQNKLFQSREATNAILTAFLC